MSYKSSGLVWIQKKIKTGKAVGPDGIPPEILKYYDIDEIINLDRLDQWSEDNLLPIPNGDNLSQVNNYSHRKTFYQNHAQSCQQNDTKSQSRHPRPVALNKPEWL